MNGCYRPVLVISTFFLWSRWEIVSASTIWLCYCKLSVRHTMTLLTVVLRVSRYIIISITCANTLSVILATMSVSIYIAAIILYMCYMYLVNCDTPLPITLLDYYLVLKQIVCILCCTLSSNIGYFLTTRYISTMLLINREKYTIVNWK